MLVGDQDLTLSEIYQSVADLFIEHPQIREAFDSIDEHVLRARFTGRAKSLLITGGSGVGKSSLLDWYYKSNFKELITETHSYRNMLSSSIPRPASISFLVEQLLRDIGDMYYNKGTLDNKLSRLPYYLEQTGVEVILLDEFQHFLNLEDNRVVKKTAEWFYSFFDKVNIPVILFGIEEAEVILEKFEPLRDMVTDKVVIKPFGFDTVEEREQFCHLLTEFDKRLPFEKHSSLSDETMAKRMFDASNGNIATIHYLITEATLLAAKEDDNSIRLRHLAQAYEKDGFANLGKGNPFCD
ncbi:TniB family NTP-binding protein [Rossellomorea aquimaris]|nr:TniB family NTP-binding protein [Rossellomorea aquimaris]